MLIGSASDFVSYHLPLTRHSSFARLVNRLRTGNRGSARRYQSDDLTLTLLLDTGTAIPPRLCIQARCDSEGRIWVRGWAWLVLQILSVYAHLSLSLILNYLFCFVQKLHSHLIVLCHMHIAYIYIVHYHSLNEIKLRSLPCLPAVNIRH